MGTWTACCRPQPGLMSGPPTLGGILMSRHRVHRMPCWDIGDPLEGEVPVRAGLPGRDPVDWSRGSSWNPAQSLPEA